MIRAGSNISDDGVVYTPVSSSNVHSVGWRGGCLFVKFHKNGSVVRRYIYYQVPQALFQAMPLTHTGSAWFDPFVKRGGYVYDEF